MSALSMNQTTTYRWTFAQDVQRYCEAGFDGIGVWRQKLSDFGEERGIDLLAESGLKVTNLLWAGGFTGNDGRSLTESLDDAAHAVRLAAAMNAGCLVVYAGGRNRHTFRHAERLLRAAFDQLLELAEATDVTLALEPMHIACSDDWTFLSDIESTIAFLESYGSPHLKLVFDTFHFGKDSAVLANLDELAPHVGVVHLGDYRQPHSLDQDRCPLGEGIVPLPEIIQGLLEAGYEGDFDVELLGRDVECREYEELLASSHSFFENACTPVVSG